MPIPMMTMCRRADRASGADECRYGAGLAYCTIGRKGLVSEESYTYNETVPKFLSFLVALRLPPPPCALPLTSLLITHRQSDIDDNIADKHAHKVLLQLLTPFNARYFTPELVSIMKPRTIEISKRIEPENEGEEATTLETQLGLSKKDDLLRRQELLKDGLWKHMATALEESAGDLLKKQFASDVVVEACVGGDGNLLEETFGAEAVDAVHDAVIGAISANTDLLEDYFGSRAIRRIVLASKESAVAQRFTMQLYKKVVKGKAATLKETHAAKIVAGLVICGCDSVAKAVRAELKKAGEDAKSILSWAEGLTKSGK